ncbi:hypothetical protein NITMOv2_0168 [Nitrospira moscoviensis]|uniref:Uncharacterized protein n=1 Tax=Nitrospira moscoviensis TaxID=42253 RepID=A0A0K2G6N5_NITMO|nr:hypothetical protein NITMOv2_0168 [Nitrospira moscoviensis]
MRETDDKFPSRGGIHMSGHEPMDGTPPQGRRIDTQIHRRRKARALSPLESEWDSSHPGPPEQLRMSRTAEPPASKEKNGR